MNTALLLGRGHFLDFLTENIKSERDIDDVITRFQDFVKHESKIEKQNRPPSFYSPSTIKGILQLGDELVNYLDEHWTEFVNVFRNEHSEVSIKARQKLESFREDSKPLGSFKLIGLILSLIWASILHGRNYFAAYTKLLKRIFTVVDYNIRAMEIGDIDISINVKNGETIQMKVSELDEFLNNGGEIEYGQAKQKRKRKTAM